jgi:2,4-dichlorophenol 6-monooxygenase
MSEPDVDVPVLIVGGGPAGLTASMLLSALEVPSLLVSRLPETSPVPRGHLLNQRTMEIFTEVGVAPAILAASTPAEQIGGVAWYAGIKGSHDDFGRRVARADAWGAGNTDPDYIAASACAVANLPQHRLEPILRTYAERQPLATVRFHHELTDLEQGTDAVTATILNRDTGDRYRVRCSYLLGADGGSTVGDLAGISTSGIPMLGRMIATHISADLSGYLHESDVIWNWISNPDRGESFVSNVLVPMGPDHWGSESEEWVYFLGARPDDPDPTDPATVLERMRTAMGLADFTPTIHNITDWVLQRRFAEDFRSGRVFLLGDAAHLHNPSGGMSLNSAIHDSHNLCWKIAAVLAGRAGDALLDTYTAERLPVTLATADACLQAGMHLAVLDEAFALSPDKSPEENWAQLRPLWEDSPDSAARRQTVNRALAEHTLEFRQHNIEFGYTYASSAIAGDGSEPDVALDPIRLYEPTTKPGHPLPHAWVERGGERIALGELCRDGRFALIAGEDGQDWVDAAEKVAAERGIPLRAARIGVSEGDYFDVRCAWLKDREISRSGAVLVRPDKYIAFRSLHAADDPYLALSRVLGQILATESH